MDTDKDDKLPTDDDVTPIQEAAWLAYQENLGNRTVGEEALAERSFKAGWTALAQLLRAHGVLPPRTEPDKAGSKPSLPRYKATDRVPRDFLAIDGDRFPLCPKCGGEADLIARPKEAPVWICDCGWEAGAG
jgi:hypothetical protein